MTIFEYLCLVALAVPFLIGCAVIAVGLADATEGWRRIRRDRIRRARLGLDKELPR